MLGMLWSCFADDGHAQVVRQLLRSDAVDLDAQSNGERARGGTTLAVGWLGWGVRQSWAFTGCAWHVFARVSARLPLCCRCC